MDAVLDLAVILPVLSVLEVLCIVFSVLFMHYCAQHRNQKLSLGWYICGVLFGLWTVLIFLIKRKEFPGPKTKVCGQCGRKFPDSFQMCSNCLIDLPEINPEEKEKERKRSKLCGIGIIVTYVATVIVGIALGAAVIDGLDDFFELTDRIAVNGVFYDKKGNSYEQANKVLLYGEDGSVYTYTEIEIVNEEDELLSYTDYYYVRDDGKKYYISDCYVTEEGWFYCDMAGALESYFPDTENMSEEELEAYYQESLENESDPYRYYDYKYTDKKGNVYYSAYEASWNEKGELITAENDVSIKE